MKTKFINRNINAVLTGIGRVKRKERDGKEKIRPEVAMRNQGKIRPEVVMSHHGNTRPKVVMSHHRNTRPEVLLSDHEKIRPEMTMSHHNMILVWKNCKVGVKGAVSRDFYASS